MTDRVSSLSCLQINLRHCRAAALSLSQFILDSGFDIILIQEPYATFINGIEVKYIPPGYVCFHNLTKDHAYGAAVFAKASLKASHCPWGVTNSISGIRVKIKHKEIFFFSVYLRPSLPIIPSSFNSLLSELCTNTRHSVFGLDSNAKNKLWNSSGTDSKGLDLESLLQSYQLNIANASLDSLSHKPSNTSFIDVSAFGDSLNLNNWRYPDFPSLSDHPFIAFSASFQTLDSSSTAHRGDGISLPRPESCNLERFTTSLRFQSHNLLAKVSTNSLHCTNDINTSISLLTESIRSCAIKSRNSAAQSLTQPKKMPWWNKKLWSLRHDLRAAYKNRSLLRSPEAELEYRLIKSKYQQALRSHKRASWKDFCSANFNGDIFGALKKITQPPPSNGLPQKLSSLGLVFKSQKQIIQCLADNFFPKQPITLPQHSVLESEVYRQLNNGPPLDYSPPITQDEIRENLKQLKNTSTPGSDGLSTIWLKLSIEHIMPLIELIFNACVSFNYFPPSWRSAKVIVLKKPNKDCYETVSSFRPISILNSLSKLFERILHTRLKKLAVDNQWFSHNQHGFREGKSTETAVTDLVNHIECSWKAKKTVACAFLDIKSAFDAAWHPMILRGLICKDCPRYLIKLIEAFLLDRTATISSDDEELCTTLEVGCLQGSAFCHLSFRTSFSNPYSYSPSVLTSKSLHTPTTFCYAPPVS